ncbi:G-protein coupled receptor [Ilyonectria robusta]
MAPNAVSGSAQRNLHALGIVERTGSVFSLIGCLFIIVTFCCSKAFHKPINRLVFYASFGNGIVNIATLMATSYVGSPNSVGCQTQAFLIQWLMPADALWTLSMAINVYLTFYHKYNAVDLRKKEFLYLICCYGIPFVPAITYVFVRDGNGHRVYGNASLWCWVSKEWGIWRILTFYGPIWKRHLPKSKGASSPEPNRPRDKYQHVHREKDDGDPGSKGVAQPQNLAYSVSITASKPGSQDSHEDTGTSNMSEPPPSPINPPRQTMSPAEWSYAKCSVLFFTAMFITWIPSSANRVYSVIHNNNSSVALEYMSAIVLPLQGFWNSIIYIVTSRKACKVFFDDVRHLGRSENTELAIIPHVAPFEFCNRNRDTHESQRDESMTELAGGGSTDVGRW